MIGRWLALLALVLTLAGPALGVPTVLVHPLHPAGAQDLKLGDELTEALVTALANCQHCAVVAFQGQRGADYILEGTWDAKIDPVRKRIRITLTARLSGVNQDFGTTAEAIGRPEVDYAVAGEACQQAASMLAQSVDGYLADGAGPTRPRVKLGPLQATASPTPAETGLILSEQLSSRLDQSSRLAVGSPPAYILEGWYRAEVKTWSAGPDSPHRYELSVDLDMHLRESPSGLIVCAPSHHAHARITSWNPSQQQLREVCQECVDATVTQLEEYCQAHP